VIGVPKVAAEDTSIVAGNIRGEKKTIPILKGSDILIDIVGTHYNRTYLVLQLMSGSYIDDEMFSKRNTFFSARYWDDPHTFNPSRFLKDWPRDAFLPFSAGERWFPFKICLFFIIKICRSPCVHWTKVCGSFYFFRFPIKAFFFFYHFFSP
jgi:hypothetical protein